MLAGFIQGLVSKEWDVPSPCSPCGHCCGSVCLRGNSKCAQVCFGGENSCHRPIIHTLSSALDERLHFQTTERYDLPCAGSSGNRQFKEFTSCDRSASGSDDNDCSGIVVGRVFGRPAVDDGDEVLPNNHPLRSSMGARQNIRTLENQFRFNRSKVQKIRSLAVKYEHWRPVRGDGNCYYRSVIIGSLESAADTGNYAGVSGIIQKFERIVYHGPEQTAHEEMLRKLRTFKTAADLEAVMLESDETDQALVRACRMLVSSFLQENAQKISQNGLTYDQIVKAVGGCHGGVAEFCAAVVEPMGRDAETLVCDVLPRCLGVGVRLWLLDRRDTVNLVFVDTLSEEGGISVHVLFKPGHYDLLYPRKAELE